MRQEVSMPSPQDPQPSVPPQPPTLGPREELLADAQTGDVTSVVAALGVARPGVYSADEMTQLLGMAISKLMDKSPRRAADAGFKHLLGITQIVLGRVQVCA